MPNTEVLISTYASSICLTCLHLDKDFDVNKNFDIDKDLDIDKDFNVIKNFGFSLPISLMVNNINWIKPQK